jgi:hypothetical protein
VVPLNQVDTVSRWIKEIRHIGTAAAWLDLAGDLAVEPAPGSACPLDRVVDVVDQEIKMDRCPMASIVTGDRTRLPSSDLHDPEDLSVELQLSPFGVARNHREAKTSAVELDREIDIVDVDADLEPQRP